MTATIDYSKYTKCPECLAYYDTKEHQCDGLMKMLVQMGKANGKQIYFTDVTPKKCEQKKKL